MDIHTDMLPFGFGCPRKVAERSQLCFGCIHEEHLPIPENLS